MAEEERTSKAGALLICASNSGIQTKVFPSLWAAQVQMASEYSQNRSYNQDSGFDDFSAYCFCGKDLWQWKILDAWALKDCEVSTKETGNSSRYSIHEEVGLVEHLLSALKEVEETGIPVTTVAKKYGFVYQKLISFLSNLHGLTEGRERKQNLKLALTPYESLYADLYDIPKGGWDLLVLPDEFQERVMKTAEESLCGRSLEIFRMTMAGYSTEELAARFEVSEERVRQIQRKNLRCLTQTSKRLYLLYGCDIRAEASRAVEEAKARYINRRVEEAEKELKEQMESFSAAKIVAEYSKDSALAEEAKAKSIQEMDLDEMDLSVRSYNCLRRAGCRTVADVLDLYEMGYLPKVRNLGQKSMKEILYYCELLVPGSTKERGDGSGSVRVQKLRQRCREESYGRHVYLPLDTILDMAKVSDYAKVYAHNYKMTTDSLLAKIALGDLYDMFRYDIRGMMRVIAICEEMLSEY